MLNILDGSAAPRGHIVIMTTKRPENLDPALVRAGRVNQKFGFGLVTKPIAEQMFVKMYELDSYLSQTAPYDAMRISEQAGEFATNVPEDKISPAALQDFIADRRTQPQQALDEVKDWAVQHLEELAEQQRLHEQYLREPEAERLRKEEAHARLQHTLAEERQRAALPESRAILVGWKLCYHYCCEHTTFFE
jgi:SpoVK/Ycf46/Vps4 family AAA+-type ATPase